ncbi:histidine--tRNA ligase [uncultured Nevskia sp.]|uniref:histidine--tRNA ligase n=1 Tax=uncultured Nevskia sp. TaxID=228950 RepID=UPI0025D79216|nr:histidine--tRNA ligase [uncultured Nevskia sp.]
MKIQSVRGMNDVLPADSSAWQHVHAVAAQVFAAYGYGELRLPVVERTELFKRAVGEVTDVVEKEMYSFEDRGGERLSLRPELTAGVIRAGIEHGILFNQQQRIWCTGPVFRYERPQAGRYRQFHQLDVEAFGIATPDTDVEIIAIAAQLWKRLGMSGFQLQINTLGTLPSRAAHRAALIDYLLQHEAALDEDARRRLHTNPLRVLDSKVPATQAIVEGAPSLLDYLDEASIAHFDAVKAGLEALGIAYVINPRLVRGLDYYTHTVFEWVTDQLGAQGTVCAGGRYDGLVEQLGGPKTTGVGFGLGIERLILLMAVQQVPVVSNQPQVYLCRFGAEAERVALQWSETLRDQLPGLRLVLNAGGGSLKSQLKRADGCGARLALIIGDDEAAAGAVQVKSLRGEGEAFTCSLTELAAELSRRLAL